MRSSLPKVLHAVAGKPMLVRVLDLLQAAGFGHPVVVVGYGAELIQRAVGPRCTYVRQSEPLGTGHAAQVGLDALPSSVERVVLVHGDEPLVGSAALCRMLDLQRTTGAPVVLLTTHVRDTRGFGRVVRDEVGRPVGLPQEADLSPEQRAIDEVNLGAYVFTAAFLRDSLPQLERHEPKGEYYLTDLIAAASAHGGVAAVTLPEGDDILGINDLVQLEQATRAVYQATNRRLMENGVTIIDTISTFIDEEVRIEPDTIIYPFTMISGQTQIGRRCLVGPSARILSSHIGEGCRIECSTIEGSDVGDEVRIGPYAHLRPGARIGSHVEIGNYAEIKESTLGSRSKMHHVGYLGDAEVGSNVNIGAGTITANFDGVTKSRTIVEDGAFIGCDTVLRAPVRVAEGAITGAGAVVTHDVPPGSVVVGVPARVVGAADHRVLPSEAEEGRDLKSGSSRRET